MLIGGFQKFSLLDYPGKLSAIIFTQGCNFRCVYCHNKDLIRQKSIYNQINPEEVLDFLKQRKGKLDAVVITGGEPTLQPDLIEFMQKIKKLGFLIKLDTNGTNPSVVQEVIRLKLADYIAMDIKAPLEKYNIVTNSIVDIEKIRESINLIMNSGTKYEFRTTVLRSQLSEEDLLQIKCLANSARLWVLQKFIPNGTLANKFRDESNYSNEDFERFRINIKNSISECFVR